MKKMIHLRPVDLHHDFGDGFAHLACEVNTRPNNPASHTFHLKMGFKAIGDADYPDYKASLRYYEKPLI